MRKYRGAPFVATKKNESIFVKKMIIEHQTNWMLLFVQAKAIARVLVKGDRGSSLVSCVI